MNRNDRTEEKYSKSKKGNGRKQRGNRTYGPNKSSSNKRGDKESVIKMDGESSKNREESSNNPLWYVVDKEVMEQASRLAFNNILGITTVRGFHEPTALIRHLNPCPMINAFWDGTATPYALKMSGINLAAYKLYNQLATITGRALQYQPQDLSTMILQMGELISMIEYVRRTFGVYFVYNERNRVYPKGIIDMMGFDSDDLATNNSNYRTEMNSIITTVNAIPIPAKIAYFDKCANLYENMYLDSPSPCAQTIVDVPYSTWILDEAAYEGGTILKTVEVCKGNAPRTLRNFIDTILKPMISQLLQSSTLNLVYADILNYNAKFDLPLWKFDYISEGYTVLPKYDELHLMQLHNTKIIGIPLHTVSGYTYDGTLTLDNDVYPDTDNNRLVHNPAFLSASSQEAPGLANPVNTIIDMDDPNPSVDDRIDMTRYIAMSGLVKVTGRTDYKYGALLPDHYCVYVQMRVDPTLRRVGLTSSTAVVGGTAETQLTQSAARLTAVHKAPLLGVIGWDTDLDQPTTIQDDKLFGEVDSLTTIDRERMARLNELYSLGLFTVRDK